MYFAKRFFFYRVPRLGGDVDNDCDMHELPRDDDTDLESFEREEQRMEEEAARVSEFNFCAIHTLEGEILSFNFLSSRFLISDNKYEMKS